MNVAGKAFLGAKPGARAKTLAAGAYSLVVKDASKTSRFRLTGPGVSRSTGAAFTGTATWKVSLKKGGTYRYGPGLSLRAV